MNASIDLPLFFTGANERSIIRASSEDFLKQNNEPGYGPQYCDVRTLPDNLAKKGVGCYGTRMGIS